jgi:FKBP-type peptidyl-prolyl cis-trans isomerase
MQETSKTGIIVSIIALLVILSGAFMIINSLSSRNDAQSKVKVDQNSSISVPPTTLPSQSAIPPKQTKLESVDTVVGTGEAVKSGDFISINYTGKLESGKVFDSSIGRKPFETQIGVGSVIKGWDIGIIGLKEGGKRTLTIPSDLAYGPRGQGSIPPNSTLIFDVELVKITKK